ncbi:hypothetical protein D3C73_1250760 [compost metagenome]
MALAELPRRRIHVQVVEVRLPQPVALSLPGPRHTPDFVDIQVIARCQQLAWPCAVYRHLVVVEQKAQATGIRMVG